jgi:hypothetical protein
LLLDARDLAGGVIDRLFPRDFLPRILDALADHRGRDAILVRGIAPSEAALDAGVTMVGAAFLARHHADDFFALHLSVKRAADAAVSAGGGDAVFWRAVFDDGFLHQCGGRASLHAGTTGDAFGIEEVFDAGSDLGIEAATLDRESKGALGFLAGTHATRADDALGRIKAEVGV